MLARPSAHDLCSLSESIVMGTISATLRSLVFLTLESENCEFYLAPRKPAQPLTINNPHHLQTRRGTAAVCPVWFFGSATAAHAASSASASLLYASRICASSNLSLVAHFLSPSARRLWMACAVWPAGLSLPMTTAARCV